MTDDLRRASQQLAEQMRRIIARLAVVRPPTEELVQAAEAAAAFADRLDALPERTRSWEVSEAGLLPRDFVAYSPVSGLSNPMSPPVRLRVEEGDAGDVVIVGDVTFGPAYEGPPGHCHGGWIAAMFDEALGFAQLAPGFTAYLHVNYRRPTPLNTNAEGLFIAPRGDGDYLSRLGVTQPSP